MDYRFLDQFLYLKYRLMKLLLDEENALSTQL